MKPIAAITGYVRNGIMTTLVQHTDGEVKGYKKPVVKKPTITEVTTQYHQEEDDDLMLFVNALPRWRQRQSK